MPIREIQKGIYVIDIPLPNNPLRSLNCYVLKGDGDMRNLIIDSGFHLKVCLDALVSGIKALELSAETTDVFFTHSHSDHAGNGYELTQMGYRVLMGERDYKFMLGGIQENWWGIVTRQMGIPDDIAEEMILRNPANALKPMVFQADFVGDGTVLHYGGRELECILTPGHTPGHICLYDRKNKLMFTGDHVLFDITPNITCYLHEPYCLNLYLENLEKIAGYDVVTSLPSHRGAGGKTMRERTVELIEHHKRRLDETLSFVSTRPEGVRAYDIAGLMTWRIRAESWDEFPLAQKWFAVGETLAHLKYLEKQGKLSCEDAGERGLIFYSK